VGKTTLTFTVSVNVLNFCFAWYQQAGRVAEMESTLTLAENVNVVLPTAPIGCSYSVVNASRDF